MWDDYKELIKSDVADIKNSGGRPAGTITAALFLEGVRRRLSVGASRHRRHGVHGERISEPFRAARPACRSARSSSSCEVALGEASRLPRLSFSSASACLPGPFCRRRCARRSRSGATRCRAGRTRCRRAWIRLARVAARAAVGPRHDPRPAAAARRHDAQERLDATRVQGPRPDSPKTRGDTIKRAARARATLRRSSRSDRRASTIAPHCSRPGALTLSDLLGRVPGLTEFTTGWLGAPAAVAYSGDVRRIRLFLDGVELDPLNPRDARRRRRRTTCRSTTLEELRIERGADEVRVYARSWRVDRTTPYTRADVVTGDQNTNLYRAFFGRRYAHGEALQLAAEQYNTQPIRALPSSDALQPHAARRARRTGRGTADLFARAKQSQPRARGSAFGGRRIDDATRSTGSRPSSLTAYARLGNGDPDRGRWFQLLAAGEQVHALAARRRTTSSTSQTDTTSVPDYVAVRRPVPPDRRRDVRSVPGVSATERLRAYRGRTLVHVHRRAHRPRRDSLSASLFGEGIEPTHPVARRRPPARVTPFGRMALFGTVVAHGQRDVRAAARRHRLSGRTIDPNGVFQPGPVFFFPGFDSLEVARYRSSPRGRACAPRRGFALRDLWFSGGVLRRGATTLLAAGELLTDTYVGYARCGPRARRPARLVSVRGRLYKALYADAWGVAWSDTTGFYRPRYQTRSELYIQTNLLDRVSERKLRPAHLARARVPLQRALPAPRRRPRSASPGYSRRSRSSSRSGSRPRSCPTSSATCCRSGTPECPGFNMPRQTQFYGVRWDFWN